MSLYFSRPLLLVGVVGSLQFSSPALSQSDKLVIGISNWAGFGPMFIAKHEGYFGSHNAKIELKNFEIAANGLNELASGKIDCDGKTNMEGP